MALSKAEWAIVEEKLAYMHEPVAIMCDGYHVILNLERVSVTKNAICIYVNGLMQLHSKDRPELARFHYPSKRSFMTAKEKREMAKEPKWLQKSIKKHGPRFDPEATYTIYKPWWGSFKALKSHLIKHNESIELLKTWRYEVQK